MFLCDVYAEWVRTLIEVMYCVIGVEHRCNITNIMVEMDRVLRPGGRVYIRDSLSLMDQLKQIATAIGWRAGVHDTGEGPHASVRILICDKGI